MARTGQKKSAERRLYFAAAAKFWHEAANVQRKRCEDATLQSNRIDLEFYSVAVQRLYNVAKMTSKKIGNTFVQNALSEFESHWPDFKSVRDKAEHITGPTAPGEPDVFYFPRGPVKRTIGGSARFIFDTQAMQGDLDKLLESVKKECEALQSPQLSPGGARPQNPTPEPSPK